MIPRSTDGRQRVLCLSYGKDSAACLGALDVLGWPLDRIISAHLWATDEIEADLPEMVDFKAKADEIIYERYGIKVEPVTCRKLYGIEKEKVTYNDIFYRVKEKGKFLETGRAIYGFPTLRGPWCQKLKTEAIRQAIDKDTIQYLGIAADEPKRFHDLNEIKQSPLVAAGWEEERCRKWCEENNLLSPIYTQTLRGGCWLCHNQGVQQLRLLRKQHPDYWKIFLQWDADSCVTFKADGHTLHDYDRRFELEDEGLLVPGETFRWTMLDGNIQLRLF